MSYKQTLCEGFREQDLNNQANKKNLTNRSITTVDVPSQPEVAVFDTSISIPRQDEGG